MAADHLGELVTRYAVEQDSGLLLASWNTGTGDTAHVVAKLPPDTDRSAGLRLAGELTELSRALWRCYTHPASAALSFEPNTAGWRREGNRAAFAHVLPALADPGLPAGGTMAVSRIPVEERAHRAGRALRELGDAAVTGLVTADVQAELKAVEQAELGDLSGRARQAVVLSRADASPVQVAVADRLLRDNPLNSDMLMSNVDPTAAAVTAAHWLTAAATVAAKESGLAPGHIVREAARIEALPYATPTLVLEALADGGAPHAVVTGLVRGAMTVAEGKLPAIELLDALAEQLSGLAPQVDMEDPGQREQLMDSLLVTPLDPLRPALDLLEDLLYGIYGCWLIFEEHTKAPGSGTAERGQLMAEFVAAVRTVAAEDRERFL